MSAAARKNSSLFSRSSHFEKESDSEKAVCNICREKITYKSTTENITRSFKKKTHFYLCVTCIRGKGSIGVAKSYCKW